MPVYSDIFNGPPRSYKRTGTGSPVVSAKKYITIHNTSNTATAEGEAAYAKTRTDGTASHYYVDSDSLIQSTNTDWCVGHVGSFEGNTYGISYEITGINSWTRTQWLSNVAWDLLAGAIARDCKQFGIPVRRLTVDEMKTGNYKGFITHNDARLAWGGTTHTDPGPGFPMDHLLALVTSRMDGDDVANIEQRDWDHARWRIWDALVAGNDDASGPDDLKGQDIWLPRAVKALTARVENIDAKVSALSAPVLTDAALAKIADLVVGKMPKPPTAEEIAAAVGRLEAAAERAGADVLDGQ